MGMQPVSQPSQPDPYSLSQPASQQPTRVHFVPAVTLTFSGVVHLAHLHPRKVTLNRRMGHGDAQWIWSFVRPLSGWWWWWCLAISSGLTCVYGSGLRRLVGGSGDPNHPRLPRTASVALMCGCKTSSRCGSVRLFPWLEQRPPSHPKTAEQADRRAVFFPPSFAVVANANSTEIRSGAALARRLGAN